MAITVPVPACADQNDPQLDDLFIALQASPSETQAANIELEIWTRWGDHPDDPFANQQMKKGIELMNSGHLGAAEETYSAALSTVILILPKPGTNVPQFGFFVVMTLDLQSDILQVIKLEPRHFGALSGLGMIRVRAGDFEGALKAYKAAAHEPIFATN